jgi:hypothetical protein
MAAASHFSSGFVILLLLGGVTIILLVDVVAGVLHRQRPQMGGGRLGSASLDQLALEAAIRHVERREAHRKRR